MASRDAVTTPFLGRGAESRLLTETIDAVATGGLRVVLVEGEAGIGKSRLVTEGLTLAEARGFLVRRGTAYELESERPFSALTEALACDAFPGHRQDTARSRRLLGAGSAPDGSAVPVGDAGFAVVEAVVDLLRSLTGRAPVALALEDLHWADVSTLQALSAVIRRLVEQPVLVLVSLRPTPRSAVLDTLVDQALRRGAHQLRLGALDDEDVATLASWAVGGRPGPRLRRQLAGTGGNPLFVIELVEALREEGVLEFTHGRAEATRVGLPPTLRLTILRRLGALPSQTVTLLRTGSVLGARFPMAELAALHGRSAVQLLPVLQPALDAGVIVGAGNHLSFRHELIRAAIYEDLPVAVRRQLHREAGTSLAAAGSQAVRVAEHFSLAAEPGDAEAVTWLRRAARQVAPESGQIAADLLERAHAMTYPQDPERDKVLADLAPLLVLTGRMTEAQALARQVLARQPGTKLAMRLHVGLAQVLVRRGEWQAAREELERGAAATTEPERSLVLAPAGFLSLVTGDLRIAAAQAEQARAAAERYGNPVALSTALMTLTGVAAADGQVAEAVRCGERAVAVAAGADTLSAGFLFPELLLGVALMDADRLTEAESTLRGGLERAARAGSVSLLPYYHASLAVRAFHAGEWDDALREVRECLALGRNTGTRWTLQSTAVRARILTARGDFAGADRVLRDGEADLERTGPLLGRDWLLWARAVLLEARGGTVHSVADAVASAWQAMPQVRFFYSQWSMAVDAVRLASAAGDRDRAGAVTEQVEQAAERSGTASAVAAARLCRGLLDSAPHVLLEAVECYRRALRPVERAAGYATAATVLCRAGRVSDATDLWRQALAIYERVGAGHAAARTTAAMRAAGLRPGARNPRRRTGGGWAALTPAELSVAALVAEGLSNRQVAERLFISRHTVESHVKHIFAKLSLTSRAELAAEFVRRAAFPDSRSQ